MADERPLIAHLLRRTTFGPRPGHVETLAARGYGTALDAILAAPALTPPTFTPGSQDDYGNLIQGWIRLMQSSDAGLHEKMVWFWHGHLTSSLAKTQPLTMARQHQTLRTHALGNARDLFQAMTNDAAMLEWLDGDGSASEGPNQNYGRELMELFALGIGHYSEDDVRAAAYALSGWVVDDKRDFRAGLHSEAGPQHDVTLLGRQVRDARGVVDAVVDHHAFAPFITTKLYRYFHGVTPTPDVSDVLAAGFRRDRYEIRPLVEAILRHPTFIEHRYTRPRFPIEWAIAAGSVLGIGEKDDLRDVLITLGQVPFEPPNVAGWAISPRWLSAGAAMTRAAFAWDHAQDTEAVSVADPVTWILERAGLYDVADSSRAALQTAANAVTGRRERATLLHALVVTSPEFALA